MAKKMTPLALMLMKSGENQRRGEGGRGRNESREEPWNQEQMRRMPMYTPPYGEPEMRRIRYPVGEYDRGEMNYQRGEGGQNEGRRSEYSRGEYGEGRMRMEDRKMGFGEQPPMDEYEMEMRRRRRRSDGTFMHYGVGAEEEPIRFGGMVSMGSMGQGAGKKKMTREMAEEWVESLEGDDPAKPSGGKWTPDQIKPVAQKYGVPTEGDRFWEFYAVMNAMYSDYYAVAKKHNALNQDFFADMAMAFISDKDAVRNKAAVYYECIAKG